MSKNSLNEKNFILVVDDDPSVCEIIISYLNAQPDFQAECVYNGADCLEYLESKVPDLLIVDRMMPGMTGTELTQKIRNNLNTKRVPIIMLTAMAQTQDVVDGFSSGVDDYLPKPFSLKEIVARSKSLIKRTKEINSLNPLLARFEEYYSAKELALLGDELRIARQIQSSLIPSTFPECPFIEFSAKIKPATVVGGDFYDTFQVKKNQIFIVIGDVVGKGIPAAMIMLMVRLFIRTLLQEGYPMDYVIQRLNNMLLTDTSSETYVSLICTSFEWSNSEIQCEMINAGHRLPLFIELNTRKVEYLPTTGGLLGLFPKKSWEIHRMNIPANVVIALYTDGILNFHQSDDFDHNKGTSWIESLILNNKEQKLDEICEQILITAESQLKPEELHDDETIVLIRSLKVIF